MSERAQDAPTLFERLGGTEAIASAVELFHERVLADEALASYFDGVDLERLGRQHVAFLSRALGGDVKYRGVSMGTAHMGLGIDQNDFDRAAEHLAESLRSLGVASELVDTVLAIVAQLSRHIVTKPNSPLVNRTMSTQSAPVDTSDFTKNAPALLSMLESCPINVLLADTDMVIRYANAASIATLKDLQALIPVRADDIVGTCIDVFHDDPMVQRRLLSDPRNLPHSAHIQLGEEVLDLLVTAVMDDSGAYLGRWSPGRS